MVSFGATKCHQAMYFSPTGACLTSVHRRAASSTQLLQELDVVNLTGTHGKVLGLISDLTSNVAVRNKYSH